MNNTISNTTIDQVNTAFKLVKKSFEQFGKVEQLEIIDDKLHVKITEGFISTFENLNKVLEEIKIASDNHFLILHKAKSENNNLHFILKPKSTKPVK